MKLHVHIDWRICTGPFAHREANVCGAPPQRGDVIVRLMHTSPPAAEARTPALGDTVVDQVARSGVLVTVCRDRIRHMAMTTRRDEAVLLGRVIAHELVHAILASTTHRTEGLMRPAWTFDEVRRDRKPDWTLSNSSVQDITWAHVVTVAR